MKKRDKNEIENNKMKNLQTLEKKYDDQKTILKKQIESLQNQLKRQIQNYKTHKLEDQKRQQQFQRQINLQKAQIQSLKNKLLYGRQQQDPDDDIKSEQELRLLTENKNLSMDLRRALEQQQQYGEAMIKMQQQLELQKDKNINLQKSLEMRQKQLKQTLQELQQLQKIIKSYKKQKNSLIQAIQNKRIIEQQFEQHKSRLQNKLNQERKKNKQLENAIQKLHNKFRQLQQIEIAKYQDEINELKNVKEQLQQKNIQLNTKLEFLSIEIKQKNQYIDNTQRQIDVLYRSNKDFEQQHTVKFQQIISENQKLKRQIEIQRNQAAKRIDELHQRYEEQNIKMKQKMIDQVYTMLKAKNNKNSKYEIFNQGLRSCKSSEHFGEMKPLQVSREDNEKVNQQEQYKQSQVKNLEFELIACKKHSDQLTIQLNKLRKMQQDTKLELQSTRRNAEDCKSRAEKKQKLLTTQLLQLRDQLGSVKDRQSELLQLKKQKAQFQEAMSLKIAFYDRKIRDLLQNIERKDKYIDNLKTNKTQLEQRLKLTEEKLGKSLQEGQNYRRLKHDAIRKDQLVRQYKNKIEKYKTDIESLKLQIENLRKEKAKTQKNLQIKEDYINNMKNKFQKQLAEIENKEKQQKINKQKQQKLLIDTKVKKLKKQCGIYLQVLEEVKDIFFQKVQEKVAKSIPQTKKKKKDWQGAQILGLKSSEVEEFINPAANLDKNICNDLGSLWQSKRYIEFFESCIQYLILKS